MTTQIDELATDIRYSGNLRSLLGHLRAFETALKDAQDEEADTENSLRARGVDICELPTFGGAEPESTLEVWSWDENSLLVGVGPFAEWQIVEREG